MPKKHAQFAVLDLSDGSDEQPGFTAGAQLARSAPAPGAAAAAAAAARQQQHPASPGSPESGATTATMLLVPGAAALDLSAAPHQRSASAQMGGQHCSEAQAAINVACAGAGRQPASPYPAPDESEGPQAAAEHAAYEARWAAGTTLSQRWSRLAASGKLEGLKHLWQQVEEELFLESVDATLLQLREQQRLQAATGGQGRKAAAGRSRSRAEMEGAAAADSSNAPRQVRARRAPAAFSDYHVEAAVAAAAADAAADGGGRQSPTSIPAVSTGAAGKAAAAAAAAPGATTPARLPSAPARASQQQQRTQQQQRQQARLAGVVQLVSQLGRAFAGDAAALAAFQQQLQQHIGDPQAAEAFVRSTLAQKQGGQKQR